ncbi:hypothetical protein QBC35DRAFT_543907 [Podospora australis]|uniref:Rad50/SbcC-type AAA domain-containing protein n=1 Tax=Podospora australis TaxID=1536484 RepID=A0AAN6WK88_9PEZI|nr:hypothetical protein QBC35DRAFT_543907 [Podospora australis]
MTRTTASTVPRQTDQLDQGASQRPNCYLPARCEPTVESRAAAQVASGYQKGILANITEQRTWRLRWLLFSDLHFKHHDLDQVQQTAQWIVAQAERHQVARAVVCGDLLTSRTNQHTKVLSACYRFLSNLSDVVPRIHILLGNHDLAYRRDYQTTALDALNIRRLAPYVSLYSTVSYHEWDGRSVLLLPFREEQNELIEAIAALDANKASKTVAFAHLAINKAITQRFTIRPDRDLDNDPPATTSVTYRGFTGPDRFASLARTFTGHFHSHQTITQEASRHTEDALRGSITYLGSPLQLSWGDLYDEKRGVVLFDPETLEHELLINPYGVDYTTADLHRVLDGQIDESAVKDKHVMLLGKLTLSKYTTARDTLLSLQVRSVRKWTPIGFTLQHTHHAPISGLGMSVPASDALLQGSERPPMEDNIAPPTSTEGVPVSTQGAEPHAETFDLAAEVREYVTSLHLDSSLFSLQDELVRVGHRIIQAAREIAGGEGHVKLDHQDFHDRSSQAVGTSTATEMAGLSTHVFVAEPHTLTIANFLGVQNTIIIDFRHDIPRGLTFLVGDNGSGKSTLVEAMVWCQFGRCVRDRLAVNDVVNDNVGKNCSVKLEFANGYAITRYRKHKTHGNRVVIALRGEPQPQFEHPDARKTQEAINELLGTDYDTYARTVVLGQGGAASFLNSTPAQRRDLIEGLLGLSILEQCGQVSRLLLRDMDSDTDEVKMELEDLIRQMDNRKQRLHYLERAGKQLENDMDAALASWNAAIRDHASTRIRMRRQEPFRKAYVPSGYGIAEHDTSATAFDQRSSAASNGSRALELSIDLNSQISELQHQIGTKRKSLQLLESSYACHIQEQRRLACHIREQRRLHWLQQELSQRLKASMTGPHPLGLRQRFHGILTWILDFLLLRGKGLLRMTGTPFLDRSQEIIKLATQKHNQEVAINNLRQEIGRNMLQMQSMKSQKTLAIDNVIGVGQNLAHRVQAAISHALIIHEQLAQVTRTRQTCEYLRQQVTVKESEAESYNRLIETDNSSLQLLQSRYGDLTTKLQDLAANRELFAFWTSALTKSSRGGTASSLLHGTTNFREHMFEKSLPELNALLAQILMVLYDDDTQHAQMAMGMLRSLLYGDSEATHHDKMVDGTSTPSSSTAGSQVLDRKLAVHHSLAYGKRSSGERKRVDLALFFALLQLARARSAHRAHYVLVDEVFDSLDEAGQAAVVRWCGAMSQTLVGWTVVITHSQYLIERDLKEEESKISVVRAKMGQKGTELFVHGRRIGGD